MKTVKHEIKLERSVKIILGVLAVGVFLNVFATPIAQEMFGIKKALAANCAVPATYSVVLDNNSLLNLLVSKH